MIRLTPEAIWALAEEIPHTVHADTELAIDIDMMASDETFYGIDTDDPTVRQLCDLWEIKYEIV